MTPLSAVWAGEEMNAHLKGPPLLHGRTDGATPFRLNLHVGDVGHALIVGPTGAGKSVLLSLLALQWRRYVGSQVFLFDKGRSARAATLAMGGTHLDLGSEGSLAFQPLEAIHQPGARAFALDWVLGLLAKEGIAVSPEAKDAVWTALGSLASAPPTERTLTGLSVLIQSSRMKQALEPYTLDGPYAPPRAPHRRVGKGRVPAG
jgi:type IV secretion system protein VirB4